MAVGTVKIAEIARKTCTIAILNVDFFASICLASYHPMSTGFLAPTEWGSRTVEHSAHLLSTPSGISMCSLLT